MLSDVADFVYKVTSYFDPATESGFRFDDPDVGIEWPDVELLYSERDRTAPRLAEIADTLPFSRVSADGRFAPSPTGTLHLGNLRTALLAWLFARSAGGRFLVRMEDLDAGRVRPGAAEQQLADLAAIGLDWDGEVVFQSAPRAIATRRRSRRCAARDRVYECFCTRAEIRAAASAPHGPLPEGAYPGHVPAPVRRRAGGEAGERAARRRCASAPDAERVTFEDRLHGPQEGVVDDFVVRRNDGAPAYNLAVVVDDAAQGIGEVVRGDDLLDSTPRQLLLAARARAARAGVRARAARARPRRRAARQAPRRRHAARGAGRRGARVDAPLARPPGGPRARRFRPRRLSTPRARHPLRGSDPPRCRASDALRAWPLGRSERR